VHIIPIIISSYYNTYTAARKHPNWTTMTTRRLITSLLAYIMAKCTKKKSQFLINIYIYTETQCVQFACIYPLPTLLLVTRGSRARSRVQCVSDCVFYGGRSTLVTAAAASSPSHSHSITQVNSLTIIIIIIITIMALETTRGNPYLYINIIIIIM